MSKPNVLEKIPMNLVEVKKELRAIKKRDTELSFRGNKTEEYINLFAVLSLKDVTDLRKKIEELDVPRLKLLHIQKIADMLPQSINELKVLLQGYALTVNNENLKRIVDVVKPFAEAAEKKKRAAKTADGGAGDTDEQEDAESIVETSAEPPASVPDAETAKPAKKRASKDNKDE